MHKFKIKAFTKRAVVCDYMIASSIKEATELFKKEYNIYNDKYINQKIKKIDIQYINTI